MIHNKYFEVLRQFLGDYTREVYGRELIWKVNLSQKGIALALEELGEKGLLKSRKEGTLKHYGLNLENTEIRDIIVVAEIIRKVELMSKNRKLAHLFRHDDRIVGIFGSYAKGTQKEDSDLDIFIIGKKSAHDYDKRGKILQTDISIKYFAINEWIKLLKEKNNLCKEIIENHAILFGTENFVKLAWSNYYGFN